MLFAKNGKSVKCGKQSVNNETNLPEATQSVANSLKITKQKHVFLFISIKKEVLNYLIIKSFAFDLFFLYLHC